MSGEKEASVGCAQLKERTVKGKVGLTPVGLQSIGFAFAVMKLELTSVVKCRELTLRRVILLHVAVGV